MRTSTILTAFAVVFIQVLAVPMQACPAFPDIISLSGSTFSELNFAVSKNGGFGLSITRPSDRERGDAQWGQYLASVAAWDKANPSPDYGDREAYIRWQQRQEDFRANETRRLNEVNGIQTESFSVVNNAVCLSAGSQCMNTGSRVLRDSAGKTIGLIEACTGGFCVFSVNARGAKDIQAPYLKIVSMPQTAGPTANPSARIEAYDRTRQIGQMDVIGSARTRGFSRSAGGSLDLRGIAANSSGSGCGAGGVSVTSYGDGRSPTSGASPAFTTRSGSNR